MAFVKVGEFFEAGGVFFFGEGGWAFGELGGGEDGLEGVVVVGGDGIEFVVVATGAFEGLAEEGDADGVGDVVQEALAGDFGDFHAGEFPGAHAEETGGDDEFGVVRVEFVTGDLFANELVVGFVVVEGANDVVAVAPGVAAFEVVGETGGVGVANDVEPVAGHAFAVVGGGEEGFDLAIE